MSTRWLRWFVMTLALGLLSSGCFQTETWTKIDGKGGMERKTDIQIAKDSKDQLKSKKEAFEKDGWTVSESEKDGKYHLTATKKFDDANKFASPFEDATVKLEKKDKKFAFTEEFDARKSAGIGESDTARSGWKDLLYTFHVTMPGKIDNSNAGKKEGNTATWEFDVNAVFDTGKFTMTAESAEGGMCGSTVFIIGLGLGAFLFLVRLMLGGVRRRLQPATAS